MDDAHNHLQFPQLTSVASSLAKWVPPLGIERMVVNGTTVCDWENVAKLAETHPKIIRPAFGLHPWHLQDRPADWREILEQNLITTPNASIGECGLDRWIENHDIDDQQQVLRAHLALAVKHDRPITIHCLKAWGALIDTLQSADKLPRGFLVHAFSGSIEIAHQLTSLGAYFSFSGYFLHDNKHAIRETYRQLLIERLLIETDAPSMPLPEKFNRFPLPSNDEETPINHPGNLVVVRDALAELRGLPTDELDDHLHENFTRLFGE